jgi:small subunit ribosomal protein S11
MANKTKTTTKTKTTVKKPRKKKKSHEYNLLDGRGQVHVKATYNNTVVTITDQQGNTIAWGSAGNAGFKGPKKSTPYAAQQIVKILADKAKARGVKSVDAFVKGSGSGRESAIRALNANGIQVLSIKDVTPIPHNGVRPRKPRRV